jgi:hypothetical protein
MKFLRFLHGSHHTDPVPGEPIAGASGKDEEFACVYAEYVSSLAQANAMLQRHGMQSPQFAQADIAGMRLFHRVKQLQGMGKPRTS